MRVIIDNDNCGFFIQKNYVNSINRAVYYSKPRFEKIFVKQRVYIINEILKS